MTTTPTDSPAVPLTDDDAELMVGYVLAPSALAQELREHISDQVQNPERFIARLLREIDKAPPFEWVSVPRDFFFDTWYSTHLPRMAGPSAEARMLGAAATFHNHGYRVESPDFPLRVRRTVPEKIQMHMALGAKPGVTFEEYRTPNRYPIVELVVEEGGAISWLEGRYPLTERVHMGTLKLDIGRTVWCGYSEAKNQILYTFDDKDGVHGSIVS